MMLKTVILVFVSVVLVTSADVIKDNNAKQRFSLRDFLLKRPRSVNKRLPIEINYGRGNYFPLLIQQNINNGSSSFNRSWSEYKVGFNDGEGSFWIGNEALHQLTTNGNYKLRFDLQSRKNPSNWYWAEYSTFIVLSEQTNYKLHVSGFSGNTGKYGMAYQNGMMFTTYDRDNDRFSKNCATYVPFMGGFWYNACAYCSANGRGSHFYWSGLPGGSYLKSSRMWLVQQ